MQNYSELALRTESPVTPEMEQRAVSAIRLLHAVAGMVTEAGEMMDQLKRHIFYGTPLDVTNLREESGDIEWYQALLRDFCHTSQELIQERNIEKLRKRYPDKYSHDKAVERNLEEERKVLEGSNIISSMEAIQDRIEFEDPTADLVVQALSSGQGWVVNSGGQLHIPGDVSNHWAARWFNIGLGGRNVKVPHWLGRRMKELRKKDIEKGEQIVSEVTDREYRKEDERLSLGQGLLEHRRSHGLSIGSLKDPVVPFLRALDEGEMRILHRMVGVEVRTSPNLLRLQDKIHLIIEAMEKESARKQTTNEPPAGSISQSDGRS